MKKIFLAVIFFLLSVHTTMAASPSPSATLSATPKLSVDYTFPYPGVLPDNALYKLKMARDRILSWFIRDDLLLAEYYLKMGDKRINAAKFLADGGKMDLAADTASKAEIYLLRSVEQAEKAKNKGADVKSFLGTLSTASLKHEEYLNDMMGSAPDGPKQALEKSIIVNNDVYSKTQELVK